MVVAAGAAVPAAGEDAPAFREAVDRVRARYASMQTYRDRGVIHSDLGGPRVLEFETAFVRGVGLKLTTVESGGAASPISFVLWGDYECLRWYASPSGLSDCRRLENLFLGPIDALVLGLLLENRGVIGLGSGAGRVEAAQTSEGRPAWLLVESMTPNSERYTWIDAESWHITRREERQPSPWKSGELRRTVDYSSVSIDAPVEPAALRFRAPFLVAHRATLEKAGLWAAVLCIPVVLSLCLGRRHGRRPSTSMPRIIAGALAWSLPLSWSLYVAGVGHGVLILPLPAWLVLGVEFYERSPNAGSVPPSWASISAFVAAYLVAAVLARRASLKAARRSSAARRASAPAGAPRPRQAVAPPSRPSDR